MLFAKFHVTSISDLYVSNTKSKLTVQVFSAFLFYLNMSKVIIDKSRGEVSLIEQDTIKKVLTLESGINVHP